jgi:hypothetical protein
MRRIFIGMTSPQEHTGVMKLSIGHYLFIWLLPAVLAVLPLTTGHYGHNENDIFCWVEGMSNEDGVNKMHNLFSFLWQLMTVGLPVTVGISYNL